MKQKTKNIIMTLVIIVVMSAICIAGCGYNKQVFDLNYKFDKAIIEGIGEVSIKKWNDYENSDTVQIVTTDGTVYYTHSSNVILIGKE